jgi:anti-sigma B factor antagonist
MDQEGRQGDVIIVKPNSTRLDAVVATQFRNELIDRITSNTDTLLIDLSDVEFIDSSGLGALVSGRKMLDASHRMALCSVNPRLENLFRVTRMDRVFEFYESCDQALQTMNRFV